MKKISILTAMAVAASLAGFAGAQDIKQYTVNWTENPPAIDGTGQLGVGDWAQAEAPAGDFRMLRSAPPNGTPSPENIQWQGLWTDDALYLLIVSDMGTWTADEFTEDNEAVNPADDLEIFLDPNRQDEPNVMDDPNARDSDSYQIQIAMPQDTNDVRAVGEDGPPFRRTMARYNALFDDLGWDPDLAIARVTSASGGKVELRIPFASLDVESGANTGLVATDGPSNGETWLFNIGRIDDALDLPIWSYHDGAQGTANAFFAERPHGEITFTGAPGETNVENFELYH